MVEVRKKANQMRKIVFEFKEDHKIFGGEFLYEDVDLVDAFQKIYGLLEKEESNPKETLRLIRE